MTGAGAVLLAAQEELSGGGLVAAVVGLGTTAALTLLVAWLGSTGRLAPNDAVGIRTKRTRASERAWYQVHRSAARWLVAAAVVLVAGPVGAVLLDDGAAQAVAILGACAAYVAVMCVGVVAAQRGLPGDHQDEHTGG